MQCWVSEKSFAPYLHTVCVCVKSDRRWQFGEVMHVDDWKWRHRREPIRKLALSFPCCVEMCRTARPVATMCTSLTEILSLALHFRNSKNYFAHSSTLSLQSDCCCPHLWTFLYLLRRHCLPWFLLGYMNFCATMTAILLPVLSISRSNRFQYSHSTAIGSILNCGVLHN